MTLCVNDTGSGIPAEALPNVFDPWSRGTREARRLGLGLSIVRSLVAHLGGTAEIKSEKGQGTTACVRIPVKVLDQHANRPPGGSAGLSGLHVLVLDDEDSVRNAVADLLRAKEAICVEAPGTVEALLELSSRAYEVALVDIQMPGADGYELARRPKARYPECETRLFAMTAFGLAEEHSSLFDAHVAKPSKADTMVSTIIQALARGKPSFQRDRREWLGHTARRTFNTLLADPLHFCQCRSKLGSHDELKMTCFWLRVSVERV